MGTTNESKNPRSAISCSDRRNVARDDILGSRCKSLSRPRPPSEWASNNCTPLRL